MERGIAVLALDSPGTGQSGVKAAPGAEKSISRVMDVVLTRSEIDPKRVALYGGSFGAHWAVALAVTERSRLRAVVAQSPLVHEAFLRERREALETNRKYLFDYIPAWHLPLVARRIRGLQNGGAGLNPVLLVGDALRPDAGLWDSSVHG